VSGRIATKVASNMVTMVMNPPQNREMSIQANVCPAGSYAALAGSSDFALQKVEGNELYE